MLDSSNIDEPTAPPTRRKKALITVLGLLFGAASAAGAYVAMGAKIEWTSGSKSSLETAYVEPGKLLLPLVDQEGDLVGYAAVDAKLEVLAADESDARQLLPVLLHEINLVAWQTGLSAGPDGMLLNTRVAEKLYLDAARRTYGKNIVRRVLLTSITPA